jgi:cysteine desulfurase
MKVVYMDNNATTRVDPAVVEEMGPYFSELYGNPSSMHAFGGRVERRVQDARERVAELLGAHADEIVFTSCGTESDNAAIHGILAANPEKRHFVTTRVEHPAVWNQIPYLKRRGYRVTELRVDRSGSLELDQLRAVLTDDTALVSIMFANNETGVVFPIREIGEMVKARGIPFHTDAVQAVGKLPIDLSRLPVDLLTLSGHKLHAPKGIGILYIRRGTRIVPFMIGGHQEKGRRGGTENVPSMIGLGKACELTRDRMREETERLRALRDQLEQGILERIPHVLINGQGAERLPNTSSCCFEYVEGESLLLMLSDLGICASSGSACTSGSLEPSHVLRAMGIPYTAVHGSVRFSLGRYNSSEEVDYILEHLPGIVERLRMISPFGQKVRREAQGARGKA